MKVYFSPAKPAPHSFAKVNPKLGKVYCQSGQSSIPQRLHEYLLELTFGQSRPIRVTFQQLADHIEISIDWIKRILKRDLKVSLFRIVNWKRGSQFIDIQPLMYQPTDSPEDYSVVREDHPNANRSKPCQESVLGVALKEKKIKEKQQQAVEPSCSTPKVVEVVVRKPRPKRLRVKFVVRKAEQQHPEAIAPLAPIEKNTEQPAQQSAEQPKQPKQPEEMNRKKLVDAREATNSPTPTEPKTLEQGAFEAISAIKTALGYEPSPQLKRVVLNAAMTTVMDAIATFEERRKKSTIERPEGFLAAAIRGEWKPAKQTHSASSEPKSPAAPTQSLEPPPTVHIETSRAAEMRAKARQIIEEHRRKRKLGQIQEEADPLVVPSPGEDPIPMSEMKRRAELAANGLHRSEPWWLGMTRDRILAQQPTGLSSA